MRRYKKSNRNSSSANKSTNRKHLTSRDVYVFVVKYEQVSMLNDGEHERCSKRLENSMEFTEEFVKRIKELESIPHEKSYLHSNKQNYAKEANGVSGYPDDSFEDERDCALQSVMTYFSDAPTDFLRTPTADFGDKQSNEEKVRPDKEFKNNSTVDPKSSERNQEWEQRKPRDSVTQSLSDKYLSQSGDLKKLEPREEMQRVMKEVLMRGEHRIKELRAQVQNLHKDSKGLREENKALKKLQKLQGKEVADMDRFVHITTTETKVIGQDVRRAEVSSFTIDTSLRRKNKEIRKLRQECNRYEKLVDMESKMLGRSVLEERLERAEKSLQDKDKKIEILSKKVKIQEKKTIQLRQKEHKKFAQLDEEVNETIQECEELTQRIKEAERKLNKTNIYSRRSTTYKGLPDPQALPALTWHPPDSRQTTSSKVKKWLNDHNYKN